MLHTYTPRSDAHLKRLLASRACPFWVQDLVPELTKKDAVDVLGALEKLVELWTARCDELSGRMVS